MVLAEAVADTLRIHAQYVMSLNAVSCYGNPQLAVVHEQGQCMRHCPVDIKLFVTHGIGSL